MGNRGCGTGTVVSVIGWYRSDHGDEKGGLEKEFLTEKLMEQGGVERRLAEYVIELAKKVQCVYEKDSRIYVLPRKIREI